MIPVRKMATDMALWRNVCFCVRSVVLYKFCPHAVPISPAATLPYVTMTFDAVRHETILNSKL
jgi:hypothetical protein